MTTSGNHQKNTGLQEAIRTWEVDRELRSYRKTGKVVFAHFTAVRDRVKMVNDMLKAGELEYVNGQIREKKQLS